MQQTDIALQEVSGKYSMLKGYKYKKIMKYICIRKLFSMDGKKITLESAFFPI